MKLTKLKCYLFVSMFFLFIVFLALPGCDMGKQGYTNEWLYPDDVETVYVKMFDSLSFRRGHEYVLTDAVCKKIEAQTPYKIVSDINVADTVLSGQITSIGSAILATDRYSGRPLEYEVLAVVEVKWKNLKTGKILINNKTAKATGSYSTQLGQDFEYASNVAVNKAADRIVEMMELPWEE
ncbi:MAG: LptE family protein [Sedimentisphaerales bacterium]|nr:LptE family protein [Sedimentisphaerales bacterium]